MITRLRIKRFKQFEDVTVDLPSHVVLAGPNNCGKTTILQALAAWHLALTTWKSKAKIRRYSGNYQFVELALRAFYSVPLRTFAALWNDAKYAGVIELEVTMADNSRIAVEFRADSSEQIYVRPTRATSEEALHTKTPDVVFVPAMGHLSITEPVYKRPKIEQLLGRGQPGDVIRNLLVEAVSGNGWSELRNSMQRLFGFNLLSPDENGADIIAEYVQRPNGPSFDIASAGSGFQQVLLLLTFLHTRPSSVILVDEPDAHLHVILQDLIFSELHRVAVERSSQLVIATHSEVIINAVAPEQICLVSPSPRQLATTQERSALAESMSILTNVDVMLAHTVSGVLFTEDYTDFEILRCWAEVLKHPLAEHLAGAREGLSGTIFCKAITTQHREGAEGIKSKDYFDALHLIRPAFRGVELIDGDGNPNLKQKPITDAGLQRLRWTRYEIESYLFHPDSLKRYVAEKVGPDVAPMHLAQLESYFAGKMPPDFLKNPFEDLPLFLGTKARTLLLPPALEAAGIYGTHYRDFYEIAALMRPNEIHPEVTQKLNDIQKALGL